MSKQVKITSPQVLVVKSGGSSVAEWITAACAVATLAVAASVANEVSAKIDDYNKKVEKTKDIVTFKNGRNTLREKAGNIRNISIFKKEQ